MTQQVAGRSLPQLTLGWRLRMSLEGQMTTNEMADVLGVDRTTVSRWLHDKGKPKDGILRQWALLVSLPFEWLKTGTVTEESDSGGPLDGGVTPLKRPPGKRAIHEYPPLPRRYDVNTADLFPGRYGLSPVVLAA